MELNFYDVFILITIFQFLFFSFFLLTLKIGNPLSNKLFAVFLFAKALCFSNSLFFRFKEFFITISPHLFYIGESFEFILGPVLFLYTISLAYQNFRLKKVHLLHLLPFLFHIGFMTYKFHYYGSDLKSDLLNGHAQVLSLVQILINYSAIYLHIIIYSIATVYVLSVYKKRLKNYFSSIEKIKLTWLQLIVTGFIILWGTAAIDFIFQVLGYRSFNLYGVSVVLLFIFANLIIYMGLKQPKIFNSIKSIDNNDKFSLPESQRVSYLKELDTIMKREKLYLNPKLTLTELADKISVPPRYISYVINKSYNQNFYDYINKYRVEESKYLLSNNRDRNQTVLEIMYDAGFNSKSVFNASFKKHAGMTPSQFKKSQ